MVSLKCRNVAFSHLNIRSICANFDIFSEFVSGGSHNFDIISLSETWLSSFIDDKNIMLPGFKIFRLDREGRGGGVAIYVRDCLDANLIDVNRVEGSQLEQLWVSVLLSGRRVCFGSLYRPPKANLLNCLNDLQLTLVDLLSQSGQIVFGGDLNVNLIDDSSLSTRHFTSFLDRLGLRQIVNEPTRCTDNSRSLLDVVVTNMDEDHVLSSEVLNTSDISDHSMVICELSFAIKGQATLFKSYRDYSKFEYEEFLIDLNSTDWNVLYDFEDVDSMVEFLNANILALFDKYAPIKNARITKRPAPWLTSTLKAMMKLRDRALQRYRKNKLPTTWEYYKQLRNLVNSSVRAEKKAFFENNYNRDPKLFWQSLKYLNINSKIVLSSFKFDATEYNDHCNNSLNIKDQTGFPELILNSYSGKKSPSAGAFSFVQVDKEDVFQFFKQIKSNAAGSDGISRFMLSLVFTELIDYITHIINKCLLSGSYPSSWKKAIVLPLPKSTKAVTMNDYRPISILPTLAKVLEKIASEQFYNYLIQFKLLPDMQSGFRKNHSTCTALLHITDEIFSALDKQRQLGLVLLDYSKAFDNVDHEILFLKLSFYGVNGIALQFFKSFLANRSQCVRINQVCSEYLPLKKGVPQGSNFGPLLFAFYVADMFDKCKFAIVHQYADDTQLMFDFDYNNRYEAMRRMNLDLETIMLTSGAHRLQLNTEKTKCILFGSKRSLLTEDDNFNLSLGGKRLSYSSDAKLLGVFLDQDMRFSSHVDYLVKCSIAKLKLLYMHKQSFTEQVRLKLCDTLILSRIYYCDVVYWPAIINRDKECLRRIQNMCLRFSYGLRKFDHVSSFLRRSGWLCLADGYKLHHSCLLYKILHSSSPTYLYNKLLTNQQNRTHVINTRYVKDLAIPKHRLAMFQRSFSYTSVKVYNSLPNLIRSSPSINTMKYRLKKYLKEKDVSA